MLDETEKIKQLADKLQKYNCVSKFDSKDEPEAWRLALSLSCLEQSFKEILDKYLPILCKSENIDEINDSLLDIGEELRHIIYHIKDPNFFKYLFEV